MGVAYKPIPTLAKVNEIQETLKGYWEKDRWDIRDSFFDELRPKKWSGTNYFCDFSLFQPGIKDEIKFFFVTRFQEHTLRFKTAVRYGATFNQLSNFLAKFYPRSRSFTDIDYDKGLIQWRSYLLEQGLAVKKDGRPNHNYEVLFNQLFEFIINFYDDLEEYEKDIWDVRKIPGAKFTQNTSGYLLSFKEIPIQFRVLVKRYIKYRLTYIGRGHCWKELMALRLFLCFINDKHPEWKCLKLLSRDDIENYLVWYKKYTQGWVRNHVEYMICLRTFLEYIQRFEYPEAPIKSVAILIWKEDIPRKTKRNEEDIKYIPEGVIQQLEDNLEKLEPEYIPIVVLLRASGWRASDVLNLRYDTCLDRTTQGWWLCGDIVKTKVLDHRIPITDEVAAIVLAVAETVRGKSTPDNNPQKLLFPTLDGKRKGFPISASNIVNALNRLAKRYNIVDDQGQIFHFGNHAFRHTKAIELINNGMNLVHVQKWMAHASPEMTLVYAKILDTTMRKSWVEATKNGIFRIDSTGKPIKIDSSNIQNEDLIEWEYIRSNLDAVRVPLGYCFKSSKLECKHQINPCLTCRNFCTTPSEIPEFEMEIMETKEQIKRGKAQGRKMWVEKNQFYLERLEIILAVLKDGKIHHQAGKKGREYVGAERDVQ